MSLFDAFSRKPANPVAPPSSAASPDASLCAKQFARLGFLSHDLRSPVASILALLDTLDQDGLKAEQLLTLARIEHYAERSLHISEQLVQLLRVESLPELEQSELDLLALAEEAQEQCQSKAKAAAVSLVLMQNGTDELWVRGQGELLERALVNLIDNAIRYSHKGGRVRVRLSTQDGQVQCAVEDDGIGMVPEDVALLFSHYGKLRQAPPQLAGAGLGLHLVAAIAERHGGSIEVSSEAGKGSCFVLRLPQLLLTGG